MGLPGERLAETTAELAGELVCSAQYGRAKSLGKNILCFLSSIKRGGGHGLNIMV